MADAPTTTDLVLAWTAGPFAILVGYAIFRYRHELAREFRSAKRLQYPGEKGRRLARTQSPGFVGFGGAFFMLVGALLVLVVGVLRVPI